MITFAYDMPGPGDEQQPDSLNILGSIIRQLQRLVADVPSMLPQVNGSLLPYADTENLSHRPEYTEKYLKQLVMEGRDFTITNLIHMAIADRFENNFIDAHNNQEEPPIEPFEECYNWYNNKIAAFAGLGNHEEAQYIAAALRHFLIEAREFLDPEHVDALNIDSRLKELNKVSHDLKGLIEDPILPSLERKLGNAVALEENYAAKGMYEVAATMRRRRLNIEEELVLSRALAYSESRQLHQGSN